jgi:hypothetical protein
MENERVVDKLRSSEPFCVLHYLGRINALTYGRDDRRTGEAIHTLRPIATIAAAMAQMLGSCWLATSSLADQQNKSSDSYEKSNQNTDDERNNRMPTTLDLFRSSAFLRRSDTQPEEKFVHSDQRRHRRGFLAIVLRL